MRRSSSIESRFSSQKFTSDVEKQLGLSLPTYDYQIPLSSRSKLKVAVILDDFSMKAWTPEWQVSALSVKRWTEQLKEEDFDFLFVESAWAGNRGEWSYHLTGTSAPRPTFVEMIDAFKDRGIPTVFWNKEDPPHFEDFLDSAKLFDFV